MAVVTIYMSDRDPNGPTFADRKAADEYDKMLEIAEVVSVSMHKHVDGVSEEMAEEIGLFLAKNKEQFLNLLRGKTADFDQATLTGPNAESPSPLRAVK